MLAAHVAAGFEHLYSERLTIENAWYVIIVAASSLLALLAVILRVRADASSSAPSSAAASADLKHVPLALEKKGARNFGLFSRLAFYFNCEGLYSDVWHRVRVLFR